MQKVPVGGSIAHAFEFLFGRFFQIIGTAWLPALLYGLGSYVLLLNMKPWMPLQSTDATTAAKTLILALGAALIATMIRSVIGISLTQEAFGVKKDLTLAHFVIGPRELRLFFAQIRFFILFAILYAVVLGLSVGALYAAKKYGSGVAPNFTPNGKPILTWVAAAFAIVIVVAFALAMLRLAFILPAVASVEHRTRLARAWAVTGGSGWRILIVCIVIFLPVALLGGAALYFLVGPNDVMNLMAAIGRAKPGSPPPVAEFYAAHALVIAAFGAVITVINAALIAGASAHAYRATTGHEDPEAEDDAALVAPLIAPVPVPVHDDHGHGGHDDHGHGGGHDDHGHGNGHGGHDDHGHGGGHDDHGHGGGHDDHGHGNGHDDHGHGGHGDGHGHGGHDEAHGHGGHDDDDDDDHDDGHGHDDHGQGGHGHDDHGHGHGHDDHGHDGGHGHDDHGHGGHGHGDGHHHHARAA